MPATTCSSRPFSTTWCGIPERLCGTPRSLAWPWLRLPQRSLSISGRSGGKWSGTSSSQTVDSGKQPRSHAQALAANSHRSSVPVAHLASILAQDLAPGRVYMEASRAVRSRFVVPCADSSGRRRLRRSGCPTGADPLHVGKIPTATESAVKIHQGQFAAEIVVDRCTFCGIHLDLGIDDLKIIGQSVIVAGHGKPDRVAIGVDGDHLLAVGLGELFVRGKGS